MEVLLLLKPLVIFLNFCLPALTILLLFSFDILKWIKKKLNTKKPLVYKY
jgi:hypothetical protein